MRYDRRNWLKTSIAGLLALLGLKPKAQAVQASPARSADAYRFTRSFVRGPWTFTLKAVSDLDLDRIEPAHPKMFLVTCYGVGPEIPIYTKNTRCLEEACSRILFGPPNADFDWSKDYEWNDRYVAWLSLCDAHVAQLIAMLAYHLHDGLASFAMSASWQDPVAYDYVVPFRLIQPKVYRDYAMAWVKDPLGRLIVGRMLLMASMEAHEVAHYDEILAAYNAAASANMQIPKLS